MLSNYLILCQCLFLLPSVFLSIRVFPNKSPLHSRWLQLQHQLNLQGWFPLGSTGFIFLLSKGLSRVFSSTTIWKHQFFSAQPSLWSNSHILTWLLEKGHFYLCFVPHILPVLGYSPICMHNLLLRWSPLQRPGGHVHTYYGVVPLPFLTPKEPSWACEERDIFLDLRGSHLTPLLPQSSASASSFVLAVHGGEQSFRLTPLDKHRLLAFVSSSLAFLSLPRQRELCWQMMCMQLLWVLLCSKVNFVNTLCLVT